MEELQHQTNAAEDDPLVEDRNMRSSVSSYEEVDSDEGTLRVKKPKSNELQASFNLFKTFIGIGILALPKSFMYTGLGLSLVVMILIGYLNYHTMLLTVEIADRKPREKITYQSMAREILGDWAYKSVMYSIFFIQTGCGISGLIFAHQFLRSTFCIYEVKELCENPGYNALFFALVIIPLTFINNLHYFYIPSLFSTIFLLVGLSAQTYYNFDLLAAKDIGWNLFFDKLGEFNLLHLPLLFGVAIYAYEGVGILFEIRASMEKPGRFGRLLSWIMISLVVIYTVFPSISYLAFGEDTPDIILLSLPKSSSYLIVKSLYALSVVLVYPLQMAPSFKIIEEIDFLKERLYSQNGKDINPPLKYSIRLLLQAIMIVIAITTKSFQLFLNLIGSCFFTYLGFVLPVIMYKKAFEGKIPRWKKIVNWTAGVIGVVLGSIGIVLSIIEMFKYDEEPVGV